MSSTAGAALTSPARAATGARTAWVYALLVFAPVAALTFVVRSGGALPAPIGVPAPPAYEVPSSEAVLRLPVFLAQIAVIIAMARGVGGLIRHLGQPQVVGEMLAGLALGPSLLGAVWPHGYMLLFPHGTVRFLNALSQVGLVLFVFLVGIDLDLDHVRAKGKQALVVSHAGIAVPMLGGGLLALLLYHSYSTPGTSFTVFALFLGCAMSVTAFPVLARILAERGLSSTRFGATAMACAAVADVTAWGILAVVVALAGHTQSASLAIWQTIGGLLAFLIVMFAVVRRVLAAVWRSADAAGKTLSQRALAGVVIVVLVSALITELLHLHAVFGAFVAGVVMPPDARLREAIRSRLEDLMLVLMLPIFFAFTGLRTNVGLLGTRTDWALALLVIGVAIAGKLGGSTLAAAATGIGARQSTGLGALMNARGLMELILLTIGLQDGIITQALFTMMVMMAVVTTMMTTPLLAWILPHDRVQLESG